MRLASKSTKHCIHVTMSLQQGVCADTPLACTTLTKLTAYTRFFSVYMLTTEPSPFPERDALVAQE